MTAASPLLQPSPYETDGGELIGRDPRTLTPEDFAGAGAPLQPVMRAIRAKCLDCVGYDASEVRKCVATSCPLWPLRMGNFPAALRVGRAEAARRARATNGRPPAERVAEPAHAPGST